MAFTTGISRTQLELCKHELSSGHHNLNYSPVYSEHCLSFMVLPRDRSGLLSPRLAFLDAVQVEVSAQIPVSSVAAGHQHLKAVQSHSSAAPGQWGRVT